MFLSTDDHRLDVVPSANLDALLDDFPAISDGCLMKVDVEGSELAVLTGGEDLVRRLRPTIVVEVAERQLEEQDASVEQLDGWFRDRDYRLFVVDGPRNFAGDTWELRPITRLGDGFQPLYDVLAIPSESSRMDLVQLEGRLDN